MEKTSRRRFLKQGARLSVLLGLGGAAVPRLAEALEEMSLGLAPVLWLQGQSCSGCSVSLLDSEAVTPYKLLTRYISLGFHQTLSAATGGQAVDVVNGMVSRGGYLLIVEGAVPAGMPQACTFGDEPFGEQLARAARQAKAVVTAGTCSSFGGVPAAEHNPTGAINVPAYLKSRGIEVPVVRLPGCPIHPDWLVGTVAQVLKVGLPAMDALGRPLAYYARTMHEQCPRFNDYEREHFAKTFGDEGCLFRLGCAGPITRTDCNIRGWNGGINSCIRAGAPCIGCGGENFAAKAEFPLITKARAAQDVPGKGTPS
ncbi:MAG: hydrogenase small subunit [Verrucomicrobiota bacterium]